MRLCFAALSTSTFRFSLYAFLLLYAFEQHVGMVGMLLGVKGFWSITVHTHAQLEGIAPQLVDPDLMSAVQDVNVGRHKVSVDRVGRRRRPHNRHRVAAEDDRKFLQHPCGRRPTVGCCLDRAPTPLQRSLILLFRIARPRHAD